MKFLSVFTIMGAIVVGHATCGKSKSSSSALGMINVVFREECSGTRGVFIKLFHIKEKMMRLKKLI